VQSNCEYALYSLGAELILTNVVPRARNAIVLTPGLKVPRPAGMPPHAYFIAFNFWQGTFARQIIGSSRGTIAVNIV
jgi:hypothetical protein